MPETGTSDAIRDRALPSASVMAAANQSCPGSPERLRRGRIAIDRSGRSYVADAAAFRINVFAPDGEPIDEIEVRFDDRQLGSPLHLTWAPDDQLYVTAVRTSMT